MKTKDPLTFWFGPPGTAARNEGEALCLALSADTSAANVDRFRDLYEKVGDDRMWAIAEREHMECIVAHAIDRTSIERSQRWVDAHAEVEAKIGEYVEVLDAIAARLAEDGIPVVALKNAGIARAIFPCLGCCPMGDLDLLVRRSDFVRAHEIMMAEGYHFEFRSPLEQADIEHAIRGGGTEYSKMLPSGRKLWVEIQWRPVAGRWIQPDQEPSGDELMERSLAVPGSAVRILCPEDNLLQVALHTAKHSYVRAPGFRLHSDVDRIVRLQDPAWDQFGEAAARAQVLTAVHISLAMAADLLATPIASTCTERLLSSSARRSLLMKWIRRVGVLGPDDRKWGRVSYIFFVSLLYDSVRGLLRGMFPPASEVMHGRGPRSRWLMPIYYVSRLFSLATRRVLR